MTDSDPKTGIYAYMHCVMCLNDMPSHLTPQIYAKLAVGVSPEGDLIVWCLRHDTPVTRMPNDKVADELMLAAHSECDCGRHKKETRH